MAKKNKSNRVRNLLVAFIFTLLTVNNFIMGGLFIGVPIALNLEFDFMLSILAWTCLMNTLLTGFLAFKFWGEGS